MQLRCPNCQIMADVAEDQQGTMVSCSSCHGMMMVPRLEKEEAYAALGEEVVDKDRPEWVKDQLKRIQADAKRKAIEPPYEAPLRLVGPVVGWSLIVGGVLCMFAGLVGGFLINGVLLSFIFFLLGAMCIIAK